MDGSRSFFYFAGWSRHSGTATFSGPNREDPKPNEQHGNQHHSQHNDQGDSCHLRPSSHTCNHL